MTFESAMTRLKKVVFKNRIRIKDFVVDFDKLRSGFVHPNHFLSALSMAKLDKELSPAELQIIADTYTVPRSPSLIMVDYKSFLDEVDTIFTVNVSGAGQHVGVQQPMHARPRAEPVACCVHACSCSTLRSRRWRTCRPSLWAC